MSKLSLQQFCVNKKIAFIIGSLGTLAAAYSIYLLTRERNKPDEYFVTLNWKGGSSQRRILILGLKGAGKTRLLQCFQKSSYPGNILPVPDPSIGFNIHSVGICGVDYHFWEGNETSGQCAHHLGITGSVDMFVWVVDSSKPSLFAESRAAMHEFLNECDTIQSLESKDCMSQVGSPLVIVASKQDIEGSVSATDLLLAMNVENIQKKHKVYTVGTQLPDAGKRKGLWRLYELVAYAEQKRYTPSKTTPELDDID
ncbi:ADP-ribosylation factor-like protein 1 [Ruditapes philippinarum]|uniref:ADP-ribosylation factor-like protein 1 n=1 Tax=Ruditapes philippinarum TaxID=129788 RepID=UPI00295AF867|nr:ADP-ribosylation factor-like protein 1 [Ruditapes philippinarum]